MSQRALGGVIVSALGRALVPSIRESSKRRLLAIATLLTAVTLASVVGRAHHEPARAVAAGQREDFELVHPVRMVKN